MTSSSLLLCVDVIDRLDALRGKGMARMYSWASKRLVLFTNLFLLWLACR